MKAAISILALAVITLHTPSSMAGQVSAHPSIEDLMTAEQYKAAGIDQLTDSQRQALSAWLQDYVGLNTAVKPPPVEFPVPAEPTDIASSTNAGVKGTKPSSKALDKNWGFTNPPEQEPEKAARLYANLQGNFRGWTGKTMFRLDNGQVWRQRRSGRFNYRGDARRVVISKNGLGFFEMRLLEVDRSVGVSRVK